MGPLDVCLCCARWAPRGAAVGGSQRMSLGSRGVQSRGAQEGPPRRARMARDPGPRMISPSFRSKKKINTKPWRCTKSRRVERKEACFLIAAAADLSSPLFRLVLFLSVFFICKFHTLDAIVNFKRPLSFGRHTRGTRQRCGRARRQRRAHRLRLWSGPKSRPRRCAGGMRSGRW